MALVLGCAHARQAEDATNAQTSEPSGEHAADAPAEAAEAPPAQAAPDGAGRDADGAEDPGEVPVALSPRGLLKPGAEDIVRERLGVADGGESLRAALQRFQRSRDLPATGVLDHETAEELGLDPDQLFERARAR